MKRRDFIVQGAMLGAGAVMFNSCASATTSPRPLFQLSLAQWSLHRALRSGQLDHLDFAPRAQRDYGIGAVEYVNQFFMDKATNATYLAEMKKRADGEGVRSVLIMCDSEGALGDVDQGERTKAVTNHYKWVEAARYLGCHSIRVNADTNAQTTEEQIKLCADGLHRLAEFSDAQGINIIIENHGGSSANGQWLASVIQRAAHRRVGSLPDFGNFAPDYDRYRGVDELMPFAKGVSAKSFDFDAAGNETQTDFMRMMQIVLKHGYHGYVGIEYEGNNLSEPAGIRATRELLLRVRDQLAA